MSDARWRAITLSTTRPSGRAFAIRSITGRACSGFSPMAGSGFTTPGQSSTSDGKPSDARSGCSLAAMMAQRPMPCSFRSLPGVACTTSSRGPTCATRAVYFRHGSPIESWSFLPSSRLPPPSRRTCDASSRSTPTAGSRSEQVSANTREVRPVVKNGVRRTDTVQIPSAQPKAPEDKLPEPFFFCQASRTRALSPRGGHDSRRQGT